MKLSLAEIASRIGAVVDGDPGHMIMGVAELTSAEEGQLAFADSDRYIEQVRQSSAGGILVSEDFPPIPEKNLLRVSRPRIAFLHAVGYCVAAPGRQGIHPRACVEEGAQLGQDVDVGACAVVSRGARIGSRTRIQAGAYVAPGTVVGEDCLIEANATLLDGTTLGDRVIVHAGAVISGDGFGYIWVDDHHHKFPHIGQVRIGDDVEIGCNSCVDRASLGVTRLGRGTKIDNLVQIAHNNEIGEHVLIAGQAGTAGSVTAGDRTTIGGHSAISDHVSLGEGAIVAGASGVAKNVPPGEVVMGRPARPIRKVQRESASLARLPELLKAFREQTRELESLKARVAELEEKK